MEIKINMLDKVVYGTSHRVELIRIRSTARHPHKSNVYDLCKQNFHSFAYNLTVVSHSESGYADFDDKCQTTRINTRMHFYRSHNIHFCEEGYILPKSYFGAAYMEYVVQAGRQVECDRYHEISNFKFSQFSRKITFNGNFPVKIRILNTLRA
jgi:hypothetical protein